MINNCNGWLVVWSLLHLAMAKSPVVKQLQHPQFDRPSENVTVTIGSLALLPCFINNLGDHKVNVLYELILLIDRPYEKL